MKDFFSLIATRIKLNKLQGEYDVLNKEFMRSAYKHVLNYSGQRLIIDTLEEENTRLNTLCIALKKEIKKLKKGNK